MVTLRQGSHIIIVVGRVDVRTISVAFNALCVLIVPHGAAPDVYLTALLCNLDSYEIGCS